MTFDDAIRMAKGLIQVGTLGLFVVMLSAHHNALTRIATLERGQVYLFEKFGDIIARDQKQNSKKVEF